MTKRDCEGWFGLIAQALDATSGYGSQATARMISVTARDLLMEEREARTPVIRVTSDMLDDHDDEVEARLLARLENEGLLKTTSGDAREILDGIKAA